MKTLLTFRLVNTAVAEFKRFVAFVFCDITFLLVDTVVVSIDIYSIAFQKI